MKKQDILKSETLRFVSELFPIQLRGVTAELKENTIYLGFYFDGEISEEIHEEAEDASVEIIAQYYDELLNEQYIRWDRPKKLPESDFWVLKRD